MIGLLVVQVSWTKEEVFDEGSPVIFCDFLKPGAEKKLYEESKDMVKMQQVRCALRYHRIRDVLAIRCLICLGGDGVMEETRMLKRKGEERTSCTRDVRC